MKKIVEDKGRVRPVVEGDFQCDENGNSTRYYEILSIVGYVKNDGTKLGYISKKDVPIGIPISNKSYWYPFQVIAVPKGDKGDPGATGVAGKSAYDLYIEQGGTIATVDEWLASLKGTDGDTWTIGDDNFWYKNGEKTEYKAKGEPGKAFTYEDFKPEELEALKGDKGEPGPKGDNGQPLMLRISSDGQSLEISSDGGDTWLMFERNFNKLRVLCYLEAVEDLPNSASAKVGDIYGVKKADEGIEPGNAAYDLWINTVTDWEEYPKEGEDITKVYDYDTELPSSATNGTVALVPVKDLTVDKEKVDGYKVYEFNKSMNGWVMLLNTAEIYASKDDIINYGDNVFALVQGDSTPVETKITEVTSTQQSDYCRIVNNTDKQLTIMLVQNGRKVICNIKNQGEEYLIKNHSAVYLIGTEEDFENTVIARSLTDADPKDITSLSYMDEGINPYYILSNDAVGYIYIQPKADSENPIEASVNAENPDTVTVQTKETTIIEARKAYKLYKRKVEWKWFGTNASITYELVQNVIDPYDGTKNTYDFENPTINDEPNPGYVNPEQSVPSVKAVKDCCEVVEDKLMLLARGVNVKLTSDKTVVYKNVYTVITLTGTANKVKAGELTGMKFFDGDAEIGNTDTDTNPVRISTSVETSADKTFSLEATIKGLVFIDSIIVYARYPIYYGFGDNAAAVAVDANRYDATTSAAHTYTKTNNNNKQQHFYILVPDGISGLSSFTMGGAPFVMNSSTQTINGISYKVYTSGNTYNSGTKVTVVAS